MTAGMDPTREDTALLSSTTTVPKCTCVPVCARVSGFIPYTTCELGSRDCLPIGWPPCPWCLRGAEFGEQAKPAWPKETGINPPWSGLRIRKSSGQLTRTISPTWAGFQHVMLSHIPGQPVGKTVMVRGASHTHPYTHHTHQHTQHTHHRHHTQQPICYTHNTHTPTNTHHTHTTPQTPCTSHTHTTHTSQTPHSNTHHTYTTHTTHMPHRPHTPHTHHTCTHIHPHLHIHTLRCAPLLISQALAGGRKWFSGGKARPTV